MIKSSNNVTWDSLNIKQHKAAKTASKTKITNIKAAKIKILLKIIIKKKTAQKKWLRESSKKVVFLVILNQSVTFYFILFFDQISISSITELIYLSALNQLCASCFLLFFCFYQALLFSCFSCSVICYLICWLSCYLDWMCQLHSSYADLLHWLLQL